MRNNQNAILIFIVICFAFTGCTESLIYSPSMNLPPRPLKKRQSQILGGIGSLPETRPHRSGGKTGTGGEMTYRIALCDHFTLQLKGWKDYSDNKKVERWGFSFSTIGMLNDSSDFRYAIIPTGAFLLGDGKVGGGGGGLFAAFWFGSEEKINFYTTIGSVIGTREISANNKQWGWGILLNAGASLLVKNRLTLNVELSGIKQVNEYEGIKDYFLCPSLNVGYIIN